MRQTAFLMLFLVTGLMGSQQTLAGPATVEKPAYFREQIPDFQFPVARGDSYDQLVPDTLDIAERMRLAIHGLTAPTDPAVDYDIYFLSIFYRNPPVLHHQYSDICAVKYWEALPLLRAATGSTDSEEVDRAWMTAILKSIGPDGLYYMSTQGRPWLQGEDMFAWCPNILWPDGTINGPRGKKLTMITDSVIMGRILAPLTIYSLRDGNPLWRDIARRMVDRLGELVIDKGDWAYLPARLHVPGSRVPAKAPMPLGLNAEELGGRQIQGLSQVYRETHYEPARVLAGKLVNYLRYHAQFYDAQGRFVDPAPPAQAQPSANLTADAKSDVMGAHLIVGGHFHCHTMGLLDMLEYAQAANDQELLGFVRKSFEWVLTQDFGNRRIGWFPEGVVKNSPVSELCSVADMIALAVKLSEAGAGDYWDDVDRWTRNSLAEGQLTRVDWIDQAGATLEKTPVAAGETTEKVAERCRGAFAAYLTGNDYGITAGAPTGTAACCVGNSARTLYYVWDSILQEDDGKLRVNLLLNRAAPGVDVQSWIPYEGRVEMKIKTDTKQVLVRAPEWVATNAAELKGEKNGQPAPARWAGRFIDLGSAKAGDTLAIVFPIAEREFKEHIGDKDYRLIVKGNDVVLVDPPGKFCPLYRRDHYRENQVRWRKTRRFAPAQSIVW